MNLISQNLINSLRRINLIFQHEIIQTYCVKDYNGFELLGYSFPKFKNNNKYNLPFFLALPLIEKNILSVSPADKCDHLDVQRHAFNEKNEQQLANPEQEFLLNKIKEFKTIMKNDVDKGIKTNLAMDNFNSYYSNLIDTRLLKILKLAISEFSLEEEKKLTTSERILIKMLSNLIKTWRNFFLEKNPISAD
ncbi:MAG: hypothetical protein ACTSU4_00345 [Promethearchaeota archaeon]